MMNSTYHRSQMPQQRNIVINNLPSSYHDATNMDCMPSANLLHATPMTVGVNFIQQSDLHSSTTTNPVSTVSTTEHCPTVTPNAMFSYRQLDAKNVHGKTAATTQPNTIYITNNVTHQALPIAQRQSRTPSSCNNPIRILSSSTAPSTSSTTATAARQQQHNPEFNENKLSDLQQQMQTIDVVHSIHPSESTHQPSALYQQSHDALQQLQQSHMPIILPQQFVPQHFSNTSRHGHAAAEHTMQLQLAAPAQEIYIPATETHCSASKAIPNQLNATVNKSQNQTVVLDRINICINNHYLDVANASQSTAIGSVAMKKTIFAAQQPSPIIPPIQHKVIESNVTSDDSDALTIVDEPDSTTTTTQTPPTTPENCCPTSSTMTSMADHCDLSQSMVLSSSCNSTTTTTTNSSSSPDTKGNLMTKSVNLNERLKIKSNTTVQSGIFTPPTPPKSSSSSSSSTSSSHSDHAYETNEDVFIQREDGRFYLGTIVDCARQEYLIRFDDRSEQWCSMHEMRKLGSSHSKSDGAKNRMCVTCKNAQSNDIVEICERCGRGYHRHCTTEIETNMWLCKRCAKPMKIQQEQQEKTAILVDDWPIVEQKQQTCYCGKNKKRDESVLCCCKCQTVYHIQCITCIKKKPLRGDCFFVFCCTLCNQGIEFVRRLQMTWCDSVHLALFNLSMSKPHQRYYHLIKDIWPFILKNRHYFPIPDEWMKLSEAKVMEKIKHALVENPHRFECEGDFGNNQFCYGLLQLEAPAVPKCKIHASVLLTDELLRRDMNLTLLNNLNVNHAKEDYNTTVNNNLQMERVKDIYEFNAEDDDTSDDEIPIKHIIEKNKKTNAKAYMAKLNKAKMSKRNNIDDNDQISNDTTNAASNVESKNYVDDLPLKNKNVDNTCNSSNKITTEMYNKEEEQAPAKKLQPSESKALEQVAGRSSRKRKAFTISKSYKEIAGEVALKRYENSRICDSSSDENSSSSRGTSLDVIIPPPKNFLGLNNPFRMATPKKNVENKKAVGVFGCNGTMIKKSIFNTSGLNFSCRLAALKKAGIFPNLSTSDLVKAAGQPRTVRTIKRRLSAKDITIGPNQEIRRRRTRRISTNVEVISTTTINTIPSNLFPIHAKDLNAMHLKWNSQQHQSSVPKSSLLPLVGPAPLAANGRSMDSLAVLQRDATESTSVGTTHGRRLRQRPQKISPSSSRRSSISCNSTYSNMSSNVGVNGLAVAAGLVNAPIASEETCSSSSTSETRMQDLKQSVNKYFGTVNRIESGEQFSICAKRQLANGQVQFLIEWGEASTNTLVT